MSDRSSKEPMALAYTTGTATEAIVVRGLLESAGIYAPTPDSAEPFPLNEPSEMTHATGIYVPKSRVEEARRMIEDYVKANAGVDSAQAAE
jgi:hypothetical protein